MSENDKTPCSVCFQRRGGGGGLRAAMERPLPPDVLRVLDVS